MITEQTTQQRIEAFLDSIIEQANDLRHNVRIPENEDFRDSMLDVIKQADSLLDDALSEVNCFDLSEWE